MTEERQKRAKIGIIFLTILVIVVCSFWLVKGRVAKPVAQNTARVVKLMKVQNAVTSKGVTYPGKIQAVKHAALFFRVSGPVIERDLRLGQVVKEGDVLMKIDPRDYERNVEVISQELAAAKSQSTLATKEYERYRKLVATNDISKAKFDTIKSQKETADAQVQRLETGLKIAQDKLSDTVLKAPFDATVSEIKIEQFEYANANQTVVVLDDLENLELRIHIPSANLPNVNLEEGNTYRNEHFTVSFPSRPDKTVTAAIYEISPVANDNEMYAVILRFSQPDDFLVLPGMSAEIYDVPTFDDRVASDVEVPYSAVFNKEGKSCVWVYQPETQKLELRAVTIGPGRISNQLTVRHNLKPGEFIVVAGGEWLTHDTPVSVMNQEILK